MNIRVIIIATLSMIFLSSLIISSSYALEKETHAALNEKIVQETMNGFSLSTYLINQLGFKGGVTELINNKEVYRWIKDGGKTEDEPGYTRSRNHFHNLLLPIDQAGLDSSIFTGKSTILWLQDQANRRTTDLGGDWSWKAARRFYYAALSGDSRGLDGFKVV